MHMHVSFFRIKFESEIVTEQWNAGPERATSKYRALQDAFPHTSVTILLTTHIGDPAFLSRD